VLRAFAGSEGRKRRGALLGATNGPALAIPGIRTFQNATLKKASLVTKVDVLKKRSEQKILPERQP
jgi:hypothetical protein